MTVIKNRLKNLLTILQRLLGVLSGDGVTELLSRSLEMPDGNMIRAGSNAQGPKEDQR